MRIYRRKTTQNRLMAFYVLLAVALTFFLTNLFWVAYTGLREVNQPLLSPDARDATIVYKNEIPKEQTRWWRLYQLVRLQESNYGTKGLAVTCRAKGGYNDIGYLPYKGFCFGTIGDQELTFANWVNKRFAFLEYSESQILCLYNEGIAHKSCAYSRGDLAKAK